MEKFGEVIKNQQNKLSHDESETMILPADMSRKRSKENKKNTYQSGTI